MPDRNVEIARGWIERWNGGERSLVEEEIHPVFELRGGRLLRLHLFTDRDEALEAAGL